MERGFSKRTAIKAINAVIRMWTEAVRKHDWDIEMPVGRLRVRKTQSNLYKSRRTRRIKGRLTSWTVYNDPYRILWRMSPEEWNKLLENLNPKDHS